MSATKNPAIASLNPGSLCHGIYSELYSQFFNAQDRKDAEHPYGVVEGDDVSIRLHNAAYGFAYAIAGAVDGGNSGEGGILLDYLRKDGGDMTGMLRANYGFEAGIGNRKVLEVYEYGETHGVRIDGALDLWGDILFGGRKAITYLYESDTLTLHSGNIDLGGGTVHSSGSIIVGDSLTGVQITPSGVKVDGHDVYHKGNANLPSVDWAMKNASVAGSLFIKPLMPLQPYICPGAWGRMRIW